MKFGLRYRFGKFIKPIVGRNNQILATRNNEYVRLCSYEEFHKFKCGARLNMVLYPANTIMKIKLVEGQDSYYSMIVPEYNPFNTFLFLTTNFKDYIESGIIVEMSESDILANEYGLLM